MTADTAHARLAELGLSLPAVPTPAAAYVPWTKVESLVFTAGQVPIVDGAVVATGLLGADISVEHGQELARVCALNVLAIANEAFGRLDGVQVVKLVVFVASTPDFTDQHLVANGASELLGTVLGDAGVHARSAVGVASLPLGCPVEVEAVLSAV